MTTALSKDTLTVCLVDDDPSVLRATRRLISSAGWQTVPFTDPKEFLKYAETHQPPLVVLDVLMPGMDGLEVQARLRHISPKTRVIILTSKDDPSIRAKALKGGASEFFIKPVHDEEFLAGIESVISRIEL